MASLALLSDIHNHFKPANVELYFQYCYKYLYYFLILTKEIKNKLFNELADWIIDRETSYPSFGECKLWIKKKNSQYIISKNDEKKILMLLTYLPMSQHMNNILYAKYLDQILTK